MRTLFMVLILVGCAPPPPRDAITSTGGTGVPEGGAGGAPEGGKGGALATGGAGGGGTAGATSPDAALGTTGLDAGPPADTVPASADRPPPSAGPGKIVLIAGGGNGGDGSPAVMASTNRPFGAVTDPMNGDVYIAEVGGRIRRIDEKGIISTVMGNGATGPGAQIRLNQPHNLLFQPNTRNLFVGDTMAGRIIKMDAATGQSTVFAGSGTQVAAGLGRTYCLAFDAAGERLYVTGNGVTIIDLKTMAVSRVNTSTPRVIAVDSKSNLYLGGGGSLTVADAMGKISAVMGSGGLSGPKHLSTDLEDNVIITDTESDTIRKYVIATKSVVKIAGGGPGALGGDPNMVRLARPHGAYVDGQGRLFIADSFNNRVLRIDY